MEYTDLENEAPWETQKRPPPSWPNKGQITFDGVNFSYYPDGPIVLKNMSATFRAREKVLNARMHVSQECTGMIVKQFNVY